MCVSCQFAAEVILFGKLDGNEVICLHIYQKSKFYYRYDFLFFLAAAML
jgi:hypothetical protein